MKPAPFRGDDLRRRPHARVARHRQRQVPRARLDRQVVRPGITRHRDRFHGPPVEHHRALAVRPGVVLALDLKAQLRGRHVGGYDQQPDLRCAPTKLRESVPRLAVLGLREPRSIQIHQQVQASAELVPRHLARLGGVEQARRFVGGGPELLEGPGRLEILALAKQSFGVRRFEGLGRIASERRRGCGPDREAGEEQPEGPGERSTPHAVTPNRPGNDGYHRSAAYRSDRAYNGSYTHRRPAPGRAATSDRRFAPRTSGSEAPRPES